MVSNASCQRGAHRHQRSPGFSPGKSNSQRHRKIIAARFGKFQKRRSHDGTDRMTTHVLSPGVAAAVPIKSCHRCDGANFKHLAEYIAGGFQPTFSTSSVIPQHCLLAALLGYGSSLPSINTFDFTTRRMDIDAPCPHCPFCGLPMQFRFREQSTLQTFDCNGCRAVLNIPPQADVVEVIAPALPRT